MRRILVASFSSLDKFVSHGNDSSIDFTAVAYSFAGKEGVSVLGRKDLWQNVRVVYLQLPPGYSYEKPHGWVTVPSDCAVPWMSLVGSHYQLLSCGEEFNGMDWVKEGSEKLSFQDTKKGAKASHLQEGQENLNGTKPNTFIDIANSCHVISEHNTHWQGLEQIHQPTSKHELVVEALCSSELKDSACILWTCKISTSYAKAGVACTKLATSDSPDCRSSAIERYLWDPPTSFGYRGRGPGFNPGCFPNVSTEEFQARLSTVLNTAIMVTYNATVLVDADLADLENLNFIWHNTKAEWSR
ncbi:hypothetical protein F25303_9345 [Fusarium sp. NRRL 25303]|nr:hypothetical protein F25303_9345 [Fusarium sp. NRRL 25303]